MEDTVVDILTDPRTGIYRNRLKQRYEAWVFDTTRGLAQLVGWLSFEADAASDGQARTIWEQEVWERALFRKDTCSVS